MAKAAVGGALRGFGDALVRRSEVAIDDRHRAEDRQHDDELALRQQAFQRASQIRNEIFGREENDKSREHDTRENARERKHQDDQVIDIVPTEGEDQAVTRSGKHRGLGFRSRSLSSGSGTDGGDGMSPGDQRLWDSVVKTYTTTGDRDGLTDEEPKPVVDWAAAAAEFAKTGREDLGARAAERAGRDSDTLDVGDSRADPPAADLRGRARSGTGGSARPGGAGTEYKSAEDVKAAVRSGKLTRDRAIAILREQFDYE